MSVSTQDVLEAFEELGDIRPAVGALRSQLEKKYDSKEATSAVNAAIDSGDLILHEQGTTVTRP